jgi:hypothetical protein
MFFFTVNLPDERSNLSVTQIEGTIPPLCQRDSSPN